VLGVDEIGVDVLGVDVLGIDVTGIDVLGVDGLDEDGLGVVILGVERLGVEVPGVDGIIGIIVFTLVAPEIVVVLLEVLIWVVVAVFPWIEVELLDVEVITEEADNADATVEFPVVGTVVADGTICEFCEVELEDVVEWLELPKPVPIEEPLKAIVKFGFALTVVTFVIFAGGG